MLAPLTLICSARSEEAEEVGPERTERETLPGIVFLDCRVAAWLGGVRGGMARTTPSLFLVCFLSILHLTKRLKMF